MRYDEFDDYNRSSRGGSRSTDRRASGSRDYSSRDYGDRDYDRSYRDYDRGYSSYDRDYDRGYSRDYRSQDRYNTRSRGYYDDFDQQDWERTAPNWDDRGSARRKSGGSTRSGGSRPASSRNGSRGSSDRRSSYDNRPRSGGRSGSSSGRRPSDSRRGAPQKRKKNIQLVPIVLGLVLIILAALIIKSFIGGSGGSDYEIELASQTIVVDETTTASIKGLSETEEYEITWACSDPNVISVDGNGKTCMLTAKNEGSVTIAATVNGETLQKTVMVVDVAPGVVGIKLDQETVEIKSGNSYTVQATVQMESDNMSPAKITWSSSDSSVALVDKNGVITGRDVGTAIIKASAGERTAEIVVTVVENPNNSDHDGTLSTGTEPEEGAVQPDNENEGGGTGNTGSVDNAASNAGEGSGSNETEGGGDAGELGSDITGESPAAE